MKNKIPLIVLIVLILIAGGVYFFKNSKSAKKELVDFAIKDTATVDKLFLADKMNNSVTLEKQEDGTWMVNKKYQARPDAVKLLLSTLYSLKVKAPVGRASFNTVIKGLSTTATKVEVYSKGEFVKTIYVGGPSMDYSGTYMMLEGSSKPFIVEIPGFEGFLSTRFFTEEVQWKNSKIFNTNYKDLQKVVFTDIVNPKNSFQIELKKDEVDAQKRKVTLSNPSTKTMIPSFDTAQVNSYLQNLLNVHFEFQADKIRESKRDSALQKPLGVIEVFGAKESKKMSLFAMPAEGLKVDFAGEKVVYDVDRLYACFNNNLKEFYICQYFVFDKVTIPIETFIRNKKSIVNK